jgi:hypothetical protein
MRRPEGEGLPQQDGQRRGESQQHEPQAEGHKNTVKGIVRDVVKIDGKEYVTVVFGKGRKRSWGRLPLDEIRQVDADYTGATIICDAEIKGNKTTIKSFRLDEEAYKADLEATQKAWKDFVDFGNQDQK